ncbi:RNA-binding protein [Mesorhizobium sp. CA14]|uniref:RNA-binding protein n=1 Tax=Mesorhizobium sp. CA14 TaxID=2876642 RepID=UPI001CCDAED4|nr:RNA-binding protein [Mesorhizobium sp. CA14]MBZ9847977.1 RNA-binding protein [Mesorhizobium sp. CA14]
MSTGPKGQKRPADVIGNAVRVMRIARGEESDDAPDGKSAAAKEVGSKGGKARARNVTARERKEIAKKAAAIRWGKGQAAPGREERV